MMSVEAEVKRLIVQVPAPPNEQAAAGTTGDAISAFERRTGLVVPASLAEWLRFANGACVGPGGLLGIRPQRASLDIEGVLRSYPLWKENGWIPVASDGCGNYYVVNTRETDVVYFIDTASNMHRLSYAVSSGHWRFLWFLLARELGNKGWPFSKEYVLSIDPEILKCTSAPLPWA